MAKLRLSSKRLSGSLKQAQWWRRNTQSRHDGLSHPLIDKRSVSLRVVKKFGDVAAPVIALETRRAWEPPLTGRTILLISAVLGLCLSCPDIGTDLFPRR